MFGMGNNRCGQLSVAGGDELVLTPTRIEPPHDSLVRIAANSTQTNVVTSHGLLYTCGDNENNELGRTGKRSLLQRVDAVETFQITDVAIGDRFSVLACHDGHFISWGRNESGQLGNGNRGQKDKPRQSPSAGSMLQISAGSDHIVALSTDGNVITWGANRKGQLGNGQFTSSCVPEVIKSLRHRPVISITCGESHTLAMTIGGNVYAWGDNSQGQLGVNDTTNRLRPEMIRSLRNALACYINAGKQHSMVVSPRGALFAFGSNSHGQLGLGEDGSDLRFVAIPTVVEKLSKYKVIQVACGSAHTLVMCRNRTSLSEEPALSSAEAFVFGMGLNSCGQLGLGHTSNVRSPTLLRNIHFETEDGVIHSPAALVSGPLAFHSFILSSEIRLAPPVLPAVNLELIKSFSEYAKRVSSVDPVKLKQFRESIAMSFSSVSVLNSSFRRQLLNEPLDNAFHQVSQSTSTCNTAVGRHGLNLNLPHVRDGYSAILSLNNELVSATLGRATLAVSEQLKECPFDEAENLSVFLIVLENPFLLNPSKYHIVLQRVITGILSLPKSYRLLLFSWLKDYESEYLSRIIKVLQNYLTFTCEDKVSNFDSSPVVLVLESVYDSNREAKIVPNDLFYNEAILKKYNIYQEWANFKSSAHKAVFNICAYPFLIPIQTKGDILLSDFDIMQTSASVYAVNKYIVGPAASGLPRRTPEGVMMVQRVEDGGINVFFEIIVDRVNIVAQTMVQIVRALEDDPDTLKLPLRIRFIDEEAVDLGGVKKEFFGLFLKAYVESNPVFTACGSYSSQQINKSEMLWFKRACVTPSVCSEDKHIDDNIGRKRFRLASEDSKYSPEFLIGVILGLAFYHRVLVNFPIPDHLYKVIKGAKLTIGDLWAADHDLARNMQFLLEYEDGVSIEQDIGITFVASMNPLLQNNNALSGEVLDYDVREAVELKPGGANIFVNKANRGEFVELFIQHALYGSCKDAIDDFVKGWQQVADSPATRIATEIEVEELACGSMDLSDFMQMRTITTYQGEFSDTHPIIEWFWDILSTFSVVQQRQFLEFVTGTYHIPVGGIQKMSLVIQSNMQPETTLPSAHTCFNTLVIPATYSSRINLERKLISAIENSKGFGFL